MIRFGAESASLSLDYTAKGREQNITMRLFPNRARVVEKNKVRVTKMSELVGSFRAVLFCPEHLSLIKGGPAERRQFLDIAISAREPAYLAALQRYGHILKQRNALIRAAEKYPDVVYFLAENLLTNRLCNPSFIAYAHEHHYMPALKLARLLGARTIAWTVRSEEEEMAAYKHGFDSVIFENYVPKKYEQKK